MNNIHPAFKHGKNLKLGVFNHIHEGVEVGDDVTLRSYVELRTGTVIGDRCYIDSGVKSSGNCQIGNDVIIRFDSIIARNVVIEDGVFISPQVMFINIPFKEKEKKPTIIRKGVKIGTNATIADGVEIGEGVIIGAKAFVNRDCLEPGTYIGIPARLQQPKNPYVVMGKNVIVEPGAVLGAQAYRFDRNQELISPKFGVILEDNVWIGTKCVIMRGHTRDTFIGKNAKIAQYCNIGHDSIIEEGAMISAGALLGGFSKVGKMTHLGMGVIIRNRVSVGKGSIIGMGSNVVKDIPDNVVAYGNPCKVIKRLRHPIKHYLRMSRLR